jgi:adenylate cyclase
MIEVLNRRGRPASIRPSFCSSSAPCAFELLDLLSTDVPIRNDSEISPGSIPPQIPKRTSKPTYSSSDIAPWQSQEAPDFDGYRRELSAIDNSGPRPRIPQVQRRQQNTGSPNAGHSWGNGSFVRPSSVFGSFYDDSTEDIAQMSPGFRPGSAQEEMDAYPRDDRRPSAASATTVSSIASKSSVGRGIRKKKLDAFFGDEFPGVEAVSRQNSASSLPPYAILAGRNNAVGGVSNAGAVAGGVMLARTGSRNNSNNWAPDRPASPASFTTRPKTPQLSEVTPWEFQEHKVSFFKFPKSQIYHGTGWNGICRRLLFERTTVFACIVVPSISVSLLIFHEPSGPS